MSVFALARLMAGIGDIVKHVFSFRETPHSSLAKRNRK